MKRMKRMISAIALIAIVGATSASAMTMEGSYRVNGRKFSWGSFYTVGNGWTSCNAGKNYAGLALYVGNSGIVDTAYKKIDRTYTVKGWYLPVSSSHWTW